MTTSGTSDWRGARVRVRAVEPEDWRAFSQNDEDTEAARLGNELEFPRSAHAAQEWARDRAGRTQPHDDAFNWTIEDEGGAIVGMINTHGCDRRVGAFEYGIQMFRDAWGKGYGPEAMELVFRFMLGERRYTKVNATVYAFNERSARMHERFGFTLEGRIRRGYFTRGEHHDVLWYGMTREEFAERYGLGTAGEAG